MDLARYAVDCVLVEHRSIRDVARSVDMSKSWVHKQLTLYHCAGYEALGQKKRGPKLAKNRTSAEIEDAIVRVRKSLTEEGFDAGARTIAWHLNSQFGHSPAIGTIHRVLVRRGFVTPQPQKRPRSSWKRFEADLPNECWQTDMTHWHLADGTGIEILNFIDDYSRMVLASVVLPVTTAKDVVQIFQKSAAIYGFPTSVLSDNGCIYTAAHRGGSTIMETELASLGIVFKHGKPYHPTTQGKVERYHHTLKMWLRRQRPGTSIEALQKDIDRFVRYYNEMRPHQARGCPPRTAWDERDKAVVTRDGLVLHNDTRVLHSKVAPEGKFTLRYKSELYKIRVGRAHKGKHVTALIANLDARVYDDQTGELIRRLTIDPTKVYQRL